MYKVYIIDKNESSRKVYEDLHKVFYDQEYRVEYWNRLEWDRLIVSANNISIYMIHISMVFSDEDLWKKFMAYQSANMNMVIMFYRYDKETDRIYTFRYEGVREKDLISGMRDVVRETIPVERQQDYILRNYRDIYKIANNDIKYVLYIAGTIEIYTKASEKLKKAGTLIEFIQEINDQAFCYIRRDCIVNLRHVNKTIGDKLYLKTGEELKMSRRKVRKIKQELTKYL